MRVVGDVSRVSGERAGPEGAAAAGGRESAHLGGATGHVAADDRAGLGRRRPVGQGLGHAVRADAGPGLRRAPGWTGRSRKRRAPWRSRSRGPTRPSESMAAELTAVLKGKTVLGLRAVIGVPDRPAGPVGGLSGASAGRRGAGAGGQQRRRGEELGGVRQVPGEGAGSRREIRRGAAGRSGGRGAHQPPGAGPVQQGTAIKAS